VKPVVIASQGAPRQEVDAQMQVDWMNARIAAIRQELLAMPAAERKVWVDLAIKELSSKGSLSAVIVRRAAQGDVLHGLLGSVIVRLYASTVHGESWNLYPGTATSSR